ncbi:MAG: Ku protein [Gemmatimonadaceae bacterium]
MASIWKGALSFGLVSIPVELKTAVRAEHVSFRMLYKKDLAPVKFERFSSDGEGPLKWDDIVKGYEYEKGRYVIMGEEDFRAASLGKSSSIEILDFVNQAEIDPRYFEKPYYLVPTKGGEKPYALLREAIRNTGVVGVGKIVMRNTQHLVGIKAMGDALVLEIMRFATELVDADDYRFPEATEVRPQELQMAEQLVHNLAGEFDPEKYTDEYRANLMKIVRAKMQGKKVKSADATDKDATDDKVVDLMDRLRESLKEQKPKRVTTKARKAPKTAKAAKTRKTA